MSEITTVPCWHCGTVTGIRSKRVGAAVCQVTCRDAAERLAPVPVPITSMRGVLLARAAPESLCRRWRAPDSPHFLVPQHVAAKLERIGHWPEGGAVSSSSSDAGRKRPADAPPEDGPSRAPMPSLPEDRGMGFLDRMVRDLRYELVRYLDWPELMVLAPHSQEAYEAVTRRLREIDALGTPLTVARLTIIDVLDAAGAAAARNDRVTFNRAMHLALVQYIREVLALPDPNDRPILLGLTLMANPPNMVVLRYLDYALLLDRSVLILFMWLWHLRRTYPGASFVGSNDYKGINALTEWKTNTAAINSANWALLTIMRCFVRAHCAVNWYHSTYAMSSNAIEFGMSDQHEPYTMALISDRPLGLVPTDDDSDDRSTDDQSTADDSSSAGYTIEELPTFAYVDVQPSSLTSAEGIYAPGESQLHTSFNADIVKALSYLHRRSPPGTPYFDLRELLRLYPGAGLDNDRANITAMPSGIFGPASPAPSSSLSAAAAAATVDGPSADWTSSDSDSDDDWSDDD